MATLIAKISQRESEFCRDRHEAVAIIQERCERAGIDLRRSITVEYDQRDRVHVTTQEIDDADLDALLDERLAESFGV